MPFAFVRSRRPPNAPGFGGSCSCIAVALSRDLFAVAGLWESGHSWPRLCGPTEELSMTLKVGQIIAFGHARSGVVLRRSLLVKWR